MYATSSLVTRRGGRRPRQARTELEAPSTSHWEGAVASQGRGKGWRSPRVAEFETASRTILSTWLGCQGVGLSYVSGTGQELFDDELADVSTPPRSRGVVQNE